MSSHQEKTSESSCDDEKDEMAIVAKRYKKPVFQKGQRMRGKETSTTIDSRVALQGVIK